MGLLEWLFGGDDDESDDGIPEIAEEFTISAQRAGWLDIEYGGELYHVKRTDSPDGVYTAAYRDGVQEDDPQPGRVFLIHGGELAFTTGIDRPNGCAVADDGTVAVVDWGLEWGRDLSGRLHAFDADGTRLLDYAFDANIEPVAITPGGSYAATGTLDPDRSVHVFDLDAGKLVLKHRIPDGPVHSLGFVEDGEWLVEFGGAGVDSGRVTLEGEKR